MFSPSEVASSMNRLIVVKKYKKQDDSCSICFDNMYNKMCVFLPCKHAFHYNCLVQLIDSKTYICPLCRHNFINSECFMNLHPLVYDEVNELEDEVNELEDEVNEFFILTILSDSDFYRFLLGMV